MKLSDAITKRKSVRKYSPRKPDWRKILRAVDMARHAPTAGNKFVMKFIIIDDKEKIASLAKISHQPFIKQAHYVVAVVSEEGKLTKRYGERGKRYSSQQAGAGIQNFLLALQEQKLSTCWIGFYDDEEVKRILSIPEEHVIEALFPIGKETKIPTKQPKKRNLETYINFNKWGRKTMTDNKKIRVDI